MARQARRPGLHGWPGRAPVPALALLIGLGGCASPMELRTLATGRSDLVAYELSGADLGVLRREALQLCPQGAEILREGGHEQRPEPADSRAQRWANASSAWFDPPRRSAQLVVLCGSAGGGLLAPAPAATATPAQPATVVSATTVMALGTPGRPAAAPAPAAVPIGPLSIEW